MSFLSNTFLNALAHHPSNHPTRHPLLPYFSYNFRSVPYGSMVIANTITSGLKIRCVLLVCCSSPSTRNSYFAGYSYLGRQYFCDVYTAVVAMNQIAELKSNCKKGTMCEQNALARTDSMEI